MVKFATINVKGLIKDSHQVSLTKAIVDGNLDVVGVQELTTDLYKPPDEYQMIVNLGEPDVVRRPRGTMILYRTGMSLGTVKKSPDGLIIRAEFMDMTVVNIYGPVKESGKEGTGPEEATRLRRIHKRFYTMEVVKYLNAWDENLIVMGDFNENHPPERQAEILYH